MEKIKTDTEFKEILNLEKAMVFIFVEWSGPARTSKRVLTEWERQSEIKIPLFQLNPDESDEISKWVYDQAKDRGGYGSLVWLKCGKILDFEWNAGKCGFSQIEKKRPSYSAVNL